ncbi:MAG: hypothetical protein LBT82_04405 [Oscillospiraceae bacterium]|jgi:hypothetical protein|nr:hypothetical protein [Oscillospiraceae bacterium]
MKLKTNNDVFLDFKNRGIDCRKLSLDELFYKNGGNIFNDKKMFKNYKILSYILSAALLLPICETEVIKKNETTTEAFNNKNNTDGSEFLYYEGESGVSIFGFKNKDKNSEESFFIIYS